MNEPTSDGMRLARAWHQSLADVRGLERALRDAEEVLRNAERDLAQFLVPKDAVAGESFCLAFGNTFLEAKLKREIAYEEGSGKEVEIEPRCVLSWRNGLIPKGW